MLDDHSRDSTITLTPINSSLDTKVSLLVDQFSIVLPSIAELMKVGESPSSELQRSQNTVGMLSVEFGERALKDLEKNKDLIGDSDKYRLQKAQLEQLLKRESSLTQPLTLESDDPYIRHALARVLAQNDYESAVAQLVQNDVPESLAEGILICVQHADIELAKRVQRAVGTRYSENSRLQMAQGVLALSMKQYAIAIRHFRTAIDRTGNTAILSYMRGLAFFLLGKYDKARSSVEQSLHINEMSLDSLILLFNITKSGDLGSATLLPRLETYTTRYPAETKAQKILAEVYYDLGKYQRSSETLKRLIAADPNSVELLNNISLVYGAQGNFEKAEQFSLLALKAASNGQNKTVVLNLFQLYWQFSKFDKIVTAYSTLELNTVDQERLGFSFNCVRFYLNSLVNLNQHEASCQVAEEFLTHFPKSRIKDYVWLLNHLLCNYCTYCRDNTRAYSIAVELENLINELDQEDLPRVLNNLAFCYLQYDDLLGATPQIGKLSSRLDKNPYFNATFGLYYFRINDIEKGDRYYERALSYATDTSLKAEIRAKRDLENGRWQFRNHKTSGAKKTLLRLAKSTEFSYIRDEAVSILERI